MEYRKEAIEAHFCHFDAFYNVWDTARQCFGPTAVSSTITIQFYGYGVPQETFVLWSHPRDRFRSSVLACLDYMVFSTVLFSFFEYINLFQVSGLHQRLFFCVQPFSSCEMSKRLYTVLRS